MRIIIIQGSTRLGGSQIKTTSFAFGDVAVVIIVACFLLVA